ncbi:MAG TPA: hypothetical protein VLM38_20715 [Blastocatellia bacterium]|nr:hypothetical protein [Blastocatellia bacterium]
MSVNPCVVSAAVEGPLDEAVVRRLIDEVGASVGPVYGRKGKGHLLQRINGYNAAARYSPWMVLVDLDNDADCAPPFRATWLATASPNMCFRVAVREVETWLFADRDRIAHFLSVAKSRIPQDPEAEGDPKDVIVRLANRSRRRDIREDMVPRRGSGRSVGPAYTSRLIEYIQDKSSGWRPQVAASHSESLRRCIACLHNLANAAASAG